MLVNTIISFMFYMRAWGPVYLLFTLYNLQLGMIVARPAAVFFITAAQFSEAIQTIAVITVKKYLKPRMFIDS